MNKLSFVPPTFILQCEDGSWGIAAFCNDKAQAAELQAELERRTGYLFFQNREALHILCSNRADGEGMLKLLQRHGFDTDIEEY